MSGRVVFEIKQGVFFQSDYYPWTDGGTLIPLSGATLVSKVRVGTKKTDTLVLDISSFWVIDPVADSINLVLPGSATSAITNGTYYGDVLLTLAAPNAGRVDCPLQFVFQLDGTDSL